MEATPTITFRPILLLLFTLALSSCNRTADQPGNKSQTVSLQSAEPDEPYTPQVEGPLRVISASPNGQLQQLADEQRISITLSQPMTPLGTEGELPANTISIDPPVEGTTRWTGSQTLVFEPHSPLQLATHYDVTLHPGLQSLDGESLQSAFNFSFVTPRPEVVSITPRDGETHARPDQPIIVSFRQPVDEESIRSSIRLTRAGREASYSIRKASDVVFHIVPDDFRLHSAYSLTVAAGIAGIEGDLPSLHAKSVKFRTYGPLRFTGVTQSGRNQNDLFNPLSPVHLRFSNSVEWEKMKDAIEINPVVEMNQTSTQPLHSTSYALSAKWRPRTEYTITVDGIEDIYGQPIEPQTHWIRFDALPSRASMSTGMLVIESKERAALPVYVTNLERIEKGIRRLSKSEIIPSLTAYDRYRYDSLEDNAPEVARSEQHIEGSEVERKTLVFDFADALRDGAGVLLAELHVPKQRKMGAARTSRAIVQVTNLGLTTKFSPHETMVLVTSLDTAEPVGGSAVEIRDRTNKVVWIGTTSSDGIALAPGWAELGLSSEEEWDDPLQFVFAEAGKDLAFSSNQYDSGLEPYRFGIYNAWKQEAENVAGSIFSDRGLYKGGETVNLKALFRSRTNADWLVGKDSIRVTIDSPRGDVVYKQTHVTNEFGSFAFKWVAPENAEQGTYYINMHHPESDLWAGSGFFRIDAFRTSTFAVTARSSAKQYIAGDIFEGTANGRYLFGAPMSNQDVRYTVYRQSGRFNPPGFDDYNFSYYEWYRSSNAYRQILQGDSTLNSDGEVSVSAVIPTGDYPRPSQLVLEASVTDQARQTLSSRTSAIVHPAEFYVGLKPQTTFMRLGDSSKEMDVDVITVDPVGATVDGAEVSVSLVRRQWNSVREVGSDGRLHWRSEIRETVVDSTRLTSQKRRATRVSMTVNDPGRYLIRAESTDNRGNPVRTESYFYATGRGYVAWNRRDDDRIDLVTDKGKYRPGETARILVQSPYEEATALVTIERDGIMSSRVETLSGSAPQIDVPLDESHLPNVFVSVILLSGRTAAPSAGADVGAPGFKIGYAELTVDPGTRHLEINIKPSAEKYEPGQEVEVALQVRDHSGAGVQAEIAFSAADAGVLNLIGYSLPDPFDVFYRSRALNVSTSETRTNIVKQRSFGQKEMDRGGGGDGDQRDQVRKDFRPSAHWDPAIVTDGRGRATVRFKVPESLTTFRLMATASTKKSEFGTSSTDIIVTKPLVALQAMPRFARIGDLFSAGVVVTNTTGQDGEVTVTASADGLQLDGSDKQSVFLADGESREVRFSWIAPEVRHTKVRYASSLGKFRDALEIDLPIALPTTELAYGTFASVEDGEAQEQIDLPDDRLRQLDDFSVRVSSTAMVGLDSATEYLFSYPYGCLEQRTSRIRPLLLADNVLEAFDLEALNGDRDEVVNEWIGELNSYWTGDGFSLWKGGHYNSAYASVYATSAMLEAVAAGYTVPEQLLSQSLDYLELIVRDSDERPEYYHRTVWGTTRALALLTLATADRTLESEIESHINETLSQNGDIETISLLLQAVVAADDQLLNLRKTELLSRLLDRIVVEPTLAWASRTGNVEHYRWIFGSDERTTANVLASLAVTTDVEDHRVIAEKMIRYLLQKRGNRGWRSTQENAVIVNSFAKYFESFEQVEPDFTAKVSAAGSTVLSEVFRGRELRVQDVVIPSRPTGPDLIPVSISRDGVGRVYYSISAKGYTTEQLDRQNNGLEVARSLRLIDASGKAGSPIGDTNDGTITLDAGDVVQVEIRVSSPTARNFVVVDDPLPAGLEALNTDFATTSSVLTRNTGSNRWWGSFNHTEMRDDRVLLFADYLRAGEHTYRYAARATTPGTYLLPPISSSLMYQPSINGRSEHGKMEVRPPAGGVASK